MASTINALHGPRKPGTVGLPFPGQQVAIADDAGQHLPYGQIGEVIICGGQRDARLPRQAGGHS